MTGLFGRIFGAKKDKKAAPTEIIEEVLNGLIDGGGFSLSFDFKEDKEAGVIDVELFGEDEELLKSKEGLLLDSIQLFVKRVLQHQLPEERVEVNIDCGGFRLQANEALIELADKLKDLVLTKGKSVYFRALPPKDRKVVHQYLAEDGRVKSRSVGEGHYKKIKIYPAKAEEARADN